MQLVLYANFATILTNLIDTYFLESNNHNNTYKHA